MAMPKRRFTLISYIVLQFVYKCLFAGEFADKKIVCRAFAKVEFSFSFPLSYKKKKERKKEKQDRSSGIRQGAIFLKFLFMVL